MSRIVGEIFKDEVAAVGGILQIESKDFGMCASFLSHLP